MIQCFPTFERFFESFANSSADMAAEEGEEELYPAKIVIRLQTPLYSFIPEHFKDGMRHGSANLLPYSLVCIDERDT
jgi:hypothetical protein